MMKMRDLRVFSAADYLDNEEVIVKCLIGALEDENPGLFDHAIPSPPCKAPIASPPQSNGVLVT